MKLKVNIKDDDTFKIVLKTITTSKCTKCKSE